MIPISIIIVAKNEAKIIGRCLESLRGLTDDILVCDTGSTDETMAIAKQSGARVIQIKWKGYGATKNEANLYSKYDWIFSLDADEYIDEKLKNALQKIDWAHRNRVFRIKRTGFFQGKKIRFGSWLGEKKIRIFSRNEACWNLNLVHEKLDYKSLEIITIDGEIIENNPQTKAEYLAKMDHYALLCANKYMQQDIQGARWKKLLSPVYNFLFNYLIRLGWLDGKEGLTLCSIHAWYTYKKYDYLCAKKRRGETKQV